MLRNAAAFALALALGVSTLHDVSAQEAKQGKQPARRQNQESVQGAPQIEPQQREFFEKKIRPVLAARCYECHSAKAGKAEGKLRLDSRETMLKGGEMGPAVVPGDPKQSVLLSAIRYEDLEMPPDNRLPDEVIADFEKWIRMGAPDPRVRAAAKDAAGGDAPKYVPATPDELWSLAPLGNPQPPDVKDAAWPRGDLDRFILARLEACGLSPVADAAPATLLRRVYFDLAGLPPSPEAIDAFLSDPSQEALAEVVDGLLASPQFGERWGRHWLDVARFAESNGKSRDVLMPHAWRYRDYVIDAYSNNVPYDRFITEQIAGDLLPAADAAERDRLNVATGFLAIGSKTLVGGTTQMDLVDEQIDATSKAVLGLTVACARCHDHKFDPVPTREYYALAGVFLSSDTRYGGGLRGGKDLLGKTKELVVLGPDADQRVAAINEHQQQLGKLNKRQQELSKRQKGLRGKLPDDWQQRLKKLRADGMLEDDAPAATNDDAPDKRAANKDEPGDKDKKNETAATDGLSKADKLVVQYAAVMGEVSDVKQQLDQLKQQKLPELDFTIGVREGKPQDSKIHIRGELKNVGDQVPRGFLTCVRLDDAPQVAPKSSGRLELARWLTHPENPLTPRVAVNRIWMHLMGRGIVGTVDNFGANGERPTHPELLDYLARRFLSGGWSTKQLIREIVLSRSYQLSSDFDETAYAADPENTLHWRMSRRRLDAEAIRDALLAAGGKLDLAPPAVAVMARVGDGEVGRKINSKPLDEPFYHRSVYLPIIRGIVPEVLKTFDFPEPSNVQGQRATTTVPDQSLFFMNSPLVIEQAEALAGRVCDGAKDDRQRIELAYKLCFARQPRPLETQRLVDFLAAAKASSSKKNDNKHNDNALSAWTTVCHALLASAEFRYLD